MFDLPSWMLFVLVPLISVVAWMVAASARRRYRDRQNIAFTADAFGTMYELSNLEHRAADHKTPDAIVRVPNGFNPGAPIHLVVYNHGFYTDIRGAYRDFKLAEQLSGVKPNTVLFLPEWQKNPGAASGDQGRFSVPMLFRDMVNEAFSKIAVLKGLSLANVDRITVLGHSAGYAPTETEIYNNGLGGKVVNVTLLDALYDKYGFDRWIKDNIRSLSAGRKRFYNFFYNSTAGYSKSQALTTKQALTDADLSESAVVTDYDNGSVVMADSAVAAQSILYKFSSVRNGEDPHYAIPKLYVRAAVLASDRSA